MLFAQDYARAAYGDQYERGHGYGGGDGAGSGNGSGDPMDGGRGGQNGSVWAHANDNPNGYPDRTFYQVTRLTR